MKYQPTYTVLTFCFFLSSVSLIAVAETSEINKQSESQELQDDIWSISVSPGESATISPKKTATLSAKAKNNGNSTKAYIYWRIPNEPLTHYLISWGAEPSKLSETARIEISQLDTVEDQVQGKMFRYDLISNPKAKKEFSDKELDLYYSLQAVNQTKLSEPTPLSRARLSRNK